MLGLGVLLLLMVTMFSTRHRADDGLERLLEARRGQRSDEGSAPQFIDIARHQQQPDSKRFASPISRDIVDRRTRGHGQGHATAT